MTKVEWERLEHLDGDLDAENPTPRRTHCPGSRCYHDGGGGGGGGGGGSCAGSRSYHVLTPAPPAACPAWAWRRGARRPRPRPAPPSWSPAAPGRSSAAWGRGCAAPAGSPGSRRAWPGSAPSSGQQTPATQSREHAQVKLKQVILWSDHTPYSHITFHSSDAKIHALYPCKQS